MAAPVWVANPAILAQAGVAVVEALPQTTRKTGAVLAKGVRVAAGEEVAVVEVVVTVKADPLATAAEPVSQ